MSRDLPARRLRAQRLTGNPLPGVVDVVRWMVAVQAQDYGAAKWALAQRTGGVTEAEVDRLFDEGAILRTHVMRPTWHFVLPEDIRWLLELTRARSGRGFTARHRELRIDPEVVARANEAFGGALAGGRHLTRTELGSVLEAAGVPAEGQRLAHLLGRAELDGVIVSGPRRGKQFTYGLLDERAPAGRALDRAGTLAELTGRHFRSHGPAQLGDFTWWSGLAVADARSGIALAGSLEHETVDGADHWFDAGSGPEPARPTSPVAHLLPNFDEYTVAYRDRAVLTHPDHPVKPALLSFGSILANVVIVDGGVRGAWSRAGVQGGVRVAVRPFDRLELSEAAAVEGAGRRLGAFL